MTMSRALSWASSRALPLDGPGDLDGVVLGLLADGLDEDALGVLGRHVRHALEGDDLLAVGAGEVLAGLVELALALEELAIALLEHVGALIELLRRAGAGGSRGRPARLDGRAPLPRPRAACGASRPWPRGSVPSGGPGPRPRCGVPRRSPPSSSGMPRRCCARVTPTTAPPMAATTATTRMSRGSIFGSSHPADGGPEDHAAVGGRFARWTEGRSPRARWALPWAAIEPVLCCAPPERHVVRLPRSLRRAPPRVNRGGTERQPGNPARNRSPRHPRPGRAAHCGVSLRRAVHVARPRQVFGSRATPVPGHAPQGQHLREWPAVGPAIPNPRTRRTLFPRTRSVRRVVGRVGRTSRRRDGFPNVAAIRTPNPRRVDTRSAFCGIRPTEGPAPRTRCRGQRSAPACRPMASWPRTSRIAVTSGPPAGDWHLSGTFVRTQGRSDGSRRPVRKATRAVHRFLAPG